MATSLPARPEPLAEAPSPEEPVRSLPELPVGAHAVIVALDAGGDPGGRLQDLGFLPGTRLQLLRRAPLGDPAVYALRGTRFCVRRAEARAVRVRVVPDPAGADAP